MSGQGPARPRKRRQPLKATPEALERAALRYLERYDSSSGHLRRLLGRKIQLSERVHGTDPEQGRAAVERVIVRLSGLGLLDDARYARARVRALLARGCSDAMIRARLRAKSLPAPLVEAALAEAGDGDAGEGKADRELRAALRYARRRRLGPYRIERPGAAPQDAGARRARELAALGRQGFAYETARRIVDSEDAAALEAELGDA